MAVTAMADPVQDFAQGNQHFENREYDHAITAYVRIIEQGYESATVYYNLANAHFKNGDLGYAILYYLKAQRLDPTDEDITSNLSFAKRLTRVQLEGVQLNPINSLFESIVAPFKLTALAWLSSVLFIVFVGFLIIRFGLGYRHGVVKVSTTVIVILLLVAALLTTYKYHHDYLTRWAVIVGEDVEVRTGPSETSGLEFQGDPGLVVTILAESGEYYEVRFENQRHGWVRKRLVAEV